MKKGISFLEQKRSICLDGSLLDLSKPVVMGIVNITPDSFYAPSRISNQDELVKRVEQIVVEGGKIVDVGGYSSRPNADDVSEEEEIRRVSEAVKVIKKHFPGLAVSVDTFRSEVVKTVASNCGAFIVNDISAGDLDNNMLPIVADCKLPYIAMHMKGSPANMQTDPEYDDLRYEIFNYFAKKIEQMEMLGLNDIIIDPGFGFGKTLDHNYQLLSILEEFKTFQLPILVGFSRKSMIYKLLKSGPETALNGTSVLNAIALQKGASILRVHDVKPAVEVVELIEKLNASHICQ